MPSMMPLWGCPRHFLGWSSDQCWYLYIRIVCINLNLCPQGLLSAALTIVLHAWNVLKEGFVLHRNHLGISLHRIILSWPLFYASWLGSEGFCNWALRVLLDTRRPTATFGQSWIYDRVFLTTSYHSRYVFNLSTCLHLLLLLVLYQLFELVPRVELFPSRFCGMNKLLIVNHWILCTWVDELVVTLILFFVLLTFLTFL